MRTTTRALTAACLLIGVLTVAGGADPSGPEPQAGRPRAAVAPLGMFSVDDSDAAMRLAAEMGLNLVHTYTGHSAASPRSLERDLAYLDLAHKHGLGVMVNLNGRRWVGRADGLAQVRRYVRQVKDHPAVAMWYLIDEPAGLVGPERLQRFYDMLKEEAPAVAVAVGHAPVGDWDAYAGCCDLALPNAFPVLAERFPDAPLRYQTNFNDRVIAAGMPLAPMLQAMNWRSMVRRGESVFRGQAASELRYPSAVEQRYWAFASLAQGARGLFWWSYYRAMQVDSRYLEEELSPVVKEAAAFIEAVGPGTRPTRIRGAEVYDAYLAVWEAGDVRYIVLASAWPTTRRLELTVPEGALGGRSPASLTPWGQTRGGVVSVRDNKLAVEVGPWDVLIWRVR